MLNFKQEELIRQLIKDVQKAFPEIEFLNVTFSHENPNELWVRVTAPNDEDRVLELVEFGGNKTIDILLDYGYHILVMPTYNPQDAKLWSHVELSLEDSDIVEETLS